MENIDIFITAFKPFKEIIKNNRYKVVCVKGYDYKGKLESYKDNVGDNISNMNDFYNELTVFYWVWKNYPMKDYVGMCSYRRYFDFFDDIDYIENYLKEYDIIVPCGTRMEGFNNLEHYDRCHNINDLMIIFNIIKRKFPDYSEDIDFFLESDELYANNMFIMKREDYIKYCEFLFTVLNEYLNVIGADCFEQVYEYVENNKDIFLIKRDKSLNNLKYQSRIGGFLAERIFSVYVSHNFKKILEIPMFFTDKKTITIKNIKK